MEGEEVFPGFDGLGLEEGGFAGECGGLPDDEGLLFVEACALEELGPVEAGGLGGEVGYGPDVVGFVDVFRFGEGELFLGDGVLEGVDACGASGGVGEAS